MTTLVRGRSWIFFVVMISAGSVFMLAGDSAGSSGAKEGVTAKTERISSAQDAFGKNEAAVKDAHKESAESSKTAGSKTTAPPAPEPAVGCMADPAVIDDIKKMRDDLDRRQKDLVSRESEIKAREKALDEELKKLDAIREEIAMARNAVKKENEEKVSKLVETFETMSPKSSSQLISSIDESLAVAAMSRMTTPKLAKIMNLMEPAKSSRLMEILAGVARAKSVALVKERGTGSAQSAAAEVTTSQKGGEK
ncbi:MAG: hypothetical protein A2583_02390 [Bdellovibrionales bacterium RIFOXYD1_FULL_53_11]|nr:MAG: hypothetical protein A2583_02390 [Bdellovibrionales bacterium RIFOXYD1_FULL_53_11]